MKECESQTSERGDREGEGRVHILVEICQCTAPRAANTGLSTLSTWARTQR
jgi:hypothetical protein